MTIYMQEWRKNERTPLTERANPETQKKKYCCSTHNSFLSRILRHNYQENRFYLFLFYFFVDNLMKLLYKLLEKINPKCQRIYWNHSWFVWRKKALLLDYCFLKLLSRQLFFFVFCWRSHSRNHKIDMI